jgi:hypothetical protein
MTDEDSRWRIGRKGYLAGPLAFVYFLLNLPQGVGFAIGSGIGAFIAFYLLATVFTLGWRGMKGATGKLRGG